MRIGGSYEKIDGKLVLKDRTGWTAPKKVSPKKGGKKKTTRAAGGSDNEKQGK